ncbi:hypothetical protein JXO52_11985 [bacterium]|nr:hypothetical protein [bacterium]
MNEKKRVLIAEKDGIVAADLKKLFEEWGYAEQAVTKTIDMIGHDDARQGYDLVVIDENCHGLNGSIHVIRRFFREYGAKVVYISDFFNTHLPECLMAEKSFYLLPKPFNQSELESIACSAAERI